MAWWNFSSAASESEPIDVPDPTGERLADPAMALLARLARNKATATMISLSNPASVNVKFVRSQGNRLTLQINNPDLTDLRVFGPLSCVMLVYVTGKQADIVVGTIIREPTLHRGRWLVLLEAGEELLRANARRTYRVPVIEDAKLEVVVRDADNRRFSLNAEDISQGGVGGTLTHAPDDTLILGSPVQVALRCGEDKVWLDAEVRFRRGSMIGLFFPGVWQRGELEAPVELRSIVGAVELAWIRRQADSEAA